MAMMQLSDLIKAKRWGWLCLTVRVTGRPDTVTTRIDGPQGARKAAMDTAQTLLAALAYNDPRPYAMFPVFVQLLK